jgi:hypothetical protein
LPFYFPLLQIQQKENSRNWRNQTQLERCT